MKNIDKVYETFLERVESMIAKTFIFIETIIELCDL